MQYEHSPDKISAALAHIPADERELWVRMGMALKSYFGDDGWPLFQAWSESASNYSAPACATTWKSCKAGGGVGIGTLLREAIAHGFDPKQFGPPPALSADELAQREAQRKAREAQALADKEAAQRRAATDARRRWERASDTGTSAYLESKKVGAHGLRFAKGYLLVPMRDEAGDLWNLQRIYPKASADGENKFGLKDGRTSGCFHTIGSPDPEGWLLVAEGYATAATLHEASGVPAVVAFNAGNLRHVAEAMRRRYPRVKLLVCADDDCATEAETGKNPGLIAAKDAARRARAAMVKPDGLPVGGSDFNDLAAACGIAAVREQLEAAMRGVDFPAATPASPPASDSRPPDAETAPPRAASALGEGQVAIVPKNGAKAAKSPRADRRPWFDVNDEGVFYHGFTDAGDALPPQWVCSTLYVSAQTRDEANDEWGFLLELQDADGNGKHWAMPARLLAGDGSEYRAKLLSMGLKIAPSAKAKNLLTMYVQTAEASARARCTDRTGWHGSVYVLPDRTIGEQDGERVLFQGAGSVVSQFRQRGTLEQWQEQVARLCVGNPLLMLCMSAAFAGPLLYHVNEPSGGLHIAGDSSVGKTTSLRVAASVFGGKDYVRSWRMTDNAGEAVAAQHSDALLILDELAQVDPKIVGDVVYMLGNEAGKGRATRTATAKAALTWRLLFLSSGEKTLSDHMLEAGKHAKAGQQVRLANVPAEGVMRRTGPGNLHGFKDGTAFSQHLQKASNTYYGSAGLAFIEWAVQNGAGLAELLREEVAERVAAWVPGGAHGQVPRVAQRFALIGAAGDLATHAGLTGWPLGEATNAARACFEAWLEDRGGAGNSEEQTMLAQVRQFFELHGAARFTWWHRLADDHAPVTMNRAGFRRMRTRHGEEIASNADHYKQFGDKMHPDDAAETQSDWFVLPEVFKKEVCRGFNPHTVARLLAQRGALVSEGASGRPDKKVKVPSIGQMRCYHITPALFELDA